MAAYKTKKPSGMKLTRKGNNVILEWKIADSDYKDGQSLAYYVFTGKTKYDKKKKKNVLNKTKTKTTKKLGAKVTSYTLKLNPKNYYPYQKNKKNLPFLTDLTYGLSAKRANFKKNGTSYTTSWSDWTKLTKAIAAPRKPKLVASYSNDYANQTTFTWETIDANTSFNWFTDYERETILVKDCKQKDGKDVSWKGATKYNTPGTTTKTQTINEGTVFSGYYSYTRWYRVRCRGPRGASPWAYAKHVYAFPPAAKNVSAVAEKDVISLGRGYLRVNVVWTADATIAHPIDKTVVEYLSTIPNTKVSINTDKYGVQYSHTELIPPTFSGGSEVSTTKDTSGKDGIVFSVPQKSDFDSCVVIRVNTHHDDNVATGATTYVTNSFGALSKPSIINITSVDPNTRRITVQAANNSEVPNTFLVVCYKSDTDPSVVQNVGIIPPGKSSVTTILPETALTDPYTIGVYAVCGDYSPIRPKSSEPTYYTISNTLITSETEWGEGVVPQPPTKIVLTSPSLGTIRVTWDWSWLDATGAELSWANHKDAWESTNEPSTYVVSNTSASAWNISGLEVGTWYVRIRLFKSDDDTTIYGAYSEIAEIKLSSAPDIPSLTLQPENGVITEDGQITCLWAYVTTDGTAQEYAEICEAVLNDDGSFTYGNIIARANRTQYLTISAAEESSTKSAWLEGETHYLAVRVTSASGETSDGWSNPVSVTIAKKLEVSITDTSLVDVTETIEDGDEIVTNTYKVLTEMPLTVNYGLTKPYDLSEDTSIQDEKVYYVKQDDEYVTPPPPYTPNPTGYYEQTITPVVIDPSALGYYEVDPEDDFAYILTEDTIWNREKTYYSRSGEGTEEDPYVYSAVPTPPIEEITYVLTSDTVWDDTKEYYVRLPVINPVELSYYEIYDQEYVLSEDVIWIIGKNYYTRGGSGTDEDPYIYGEVLEPEFIFNVVPKPVENPSVLNYYEYQELEGTSTIVIERAEPYPMDRPDDTQYDGFEGETIAMINQPNANNVIFDQEDDRVGILDDNAKYRIILSVVDSYGQVAQADPVEFIVKWNHQAVMPEAEIEAFKDDIYTTIIPITPTGYYELSQDVEVIEGKTYYSRSGEGTEEDPYVYEEIVNPTGNPHASNYYEPYISINDTCDVYRLSVDSPELIIKDAVFGTKYVDPYPTLKEFGGYRVVYRTVNGDYITDDNRLAWVDYNDPDLHQIDRFLTIIDFGKDRVLLPYDLELSNKWSKDFIETKYLGGSVQGDWNPAVSRTGTIKSNVIVFEDPDTIKAMRRLANYAGICHIRTPDGSNFEANINVSEDRENKKIGKIAKFSLDITRVDSEDYDGVLYDVWISDNT